MARTRWVAVIAVAAFALYFFTTAPTVLWGDDAELQRVAVTSAQPEGSGRVYPLWGMFAHTAARIPVGEPAWRINVMSGAFGAVTVALIFIVILAITGSSHAAALSAGALAVSHTLWLHSVRAEVYTVFTAAYAAALGLLVMSVVRRHQPTALAGLALACLALGAHLMAVSLLPWAAAVVVWLALTSRRDSLKTPPSPSAARNLVWVLTLVLVLLFTAPVWIAALTGAALPARAGRMVADAFRVRPRDLAMWAGFLAYQFPLGLPLAWLGLRRLFRTTPPVAWLTSGAYASAVVLALASRTPDAYVYYLPSYLVFTLWLGAGVTAVLRERSRLAGTLLVALVALPPLAYRATPAVLTATNIRLLDVRDLPYRDSRMFFFYPPKNGYVGARRYGQAALDGVAPGAAVLADWLPLQTLRYLQVVEARRPDVKLHGELPARGRQLPWLLRQADQGPVYLAATGRYYDMGEIETHFRVVADGVVFRLDDPR